MPNHIGASILVAIPLAFLVSGCVGMLIERGVVRFLYGRPLETLLATFGVSLILQQVVRDVFSANNRPVETPAWMAGSMQINEALSITYNRLYVILFMIIVFVDPAAGAAEDLAGSQGSRRRAEPQHGEGHGRAHAMGGCDDVRTGLRHRGRRGRRAEPAHQRRARTSGSNTSSTPSWWWCSAASAICGAR